MKISSNILMYAAFFAVSAVFLAAEELTHFEFLYHLAAIPLEVMVAVLIVEKALDKQASREKRRQLMFIKSHLFRSDMRGLFLADFQALKTPPLTLTGIRSAGLAELKAMLRDAEAVEFKSPEAMEAAILEYVKAERVWHAFMERAIAFNFESIFNDMIAILHFINDVKIFKEHHPDRMFIGEALKHPTLAARVRDVLGDGIRRFLEYAIELKEKQPAMFEDILDDYALSENIRDIADDSAPGGV
jgi:hypothetical protein